MAVAQHSDPTKSDPAKADSQKSDPARRSDPIRKTGDTAGDAMDQAHDRASDLLAINRENLGRAAEIQEKAAGNAQQVVQIGVEAIIRNAREMNDQMARTLGFGGDDGERFAGQTRQNVEALTRCGTILTQACQDAWQSAFELGRRRWQRNVESLNRLARARTVQELATLQSEMMREGVQSLVHDTRTVAEASLQAFDEAGRVCSGVTPLPLPR